MCSRQQIFHRRWQNRRLPAHFDWAGLDFDVYVKFFLIHRPDLFRTGYQNQAISGLELGQVCEGKAAHPQAPKIMVSTPQG